MSTAKFNQWLNSDGTENYKCRAWVNFNGTGTVAIRASGNVSSITDNGTGNYTVNFTTALPDVNYAAVCNLGSARTDTLSGGLAQVTETGYALSSTTAFRFFTSQAYSAFEFIDHPYLTVSIFR